MAFSDFLKATEPGAKAYSTLKSYTKDEIIEEIRILEHNLASSDEMYNRGVVRQMSLGSHFPQIWDWEKVIYDADGGSNWRIMTQEIPVGEDCYKLHKGKGCVHCGNKKCSFNPFREHDLTINPEDLPTTSGWVECYLKTEAISYPMDLYFDEKSKRFLDNRRRNVFELYTVENIFHEQLFTDDLCNRTEEVVAWREIEPFAVESQK